MRKLTLAFSLSLALLAGCKKDVTGPQYDPATAVTLKDQAYGTDALQKLDVYLPANRTAATKVLFLLHGGAWTSGDKTDINFFIDTLRRRYPELAIVNPNYRLGTPTTLHPAEMDDVKKALDYVDSKNFDWTVSKTYALGGVSSGAHMAMLFSYKFDNPKRIKVVGSVIGPSNFADDYYKTNPLFQNIMVQYLGKTWLQDSALHKAASPVNYVTATSQPTFMAYAGADLLVPTTNATILRNKIQSLGVTNAYYFYPTDGHDLSPAAIDDIINKLIPFLKTNL